MLKKRAAPYLLIFFALWGCTGTKPPVSKLDAKTGAPGSASAANRMPALEPEEKMFFSEVEEFVGLGLESMKDSLWFQAGEDFDSALVRLSVLEATDSLSAKVYSTINVYRDSVQKLLVQTVARTSTLSQPIPWTAQFDEQMQEVSDSSVKAMDSITHQINPKNYDLPLPAPLDPRIFQAMAVFMGPGRGYFTKWLERKSRYENLIQEKLKVRGMPRDLMYLAMVESGFNPKAWSKASASGMWQFIASTARRYGLMDDWWFDPRRDPVAATEAALDYLKDLHDEFGDWHQAMAAYNCGENKIRKLRAIDSTMSYWKMPLPQETRFYVPKILAAMIIGHNPERYGFAIENPEPPLVFDTATVRHCLSIGTIAKACGATEDNIIDLNPSLRRWCTPPNRNLHVIYLPAGTREKFCSMYAQMDTTKLVNWHHHVVLHGENLGSISAKYHVSVAAIKATNKLKGNHLSRGQSLLIPLAPEDAKKYQELDQTGDGLAKTSKLKNGTYRVRSGDNLFDIARRYGTTVGQLLAANGLHPGAIIHTGQRLRLEARSKGRAQADESDDSRQEPVVAEASDNSESPRAASAPAPATAASPAHDEAPALAANEGQVYEVSAQETLYSIARKLGVTQDDLRRWNGLDGNRIMAGQKLKYRAPVESSAAATASASVKPVLLAASAPSLTPVSETLPAPDYYVVKSGDSLWDISVKFRSTVERLKALNGRLPAVLRPGTRIRIR